MKMHIKMNKFYFSVWLNDLYNYKLCKNKNYCKMFLKMYSITHIDYYLQHRYTAVHIDVCKIHNTYDRSVIKSK